MLIGFPGIGRFVASLLAAAAVGLGVLGYLLQGFAGAAVATIAIFTPALILLVAVAPFLDTLGRSRQFKKALTGILASFVGLLFFVTVKFALAVPWDAARILLAAASFVALLRETASEGSSKSWQTHDSEAIIRSAQEMLLQKYGINHTTIQLLPFSAGEMEHCSHCN